MTNGVVGDVREIRVVPKLFRYLGRDNGNVPIASALPQTGA
jgi:hypothetical protein